MKRPGRGLTPDEAALWARVAKTVRPLEGRHPPRHGEGDQPQAGGGGFRLGATPMRPGPVATAVLPGASPLHHDAARRGPPPRSGEDSRSTSPERHGLDAGWDRRLARGVVHPDFTLDLHGASLDAAHARLDHGLTQALAHGARVVLLITGRARLSDDHAGRSNRRGAIRAKFLDWLMAGPHASRIAAVRPAHPRHGGAGAVYIVLRRAR